MRLTLPFQIYAAILHRDYNTPVYEISGGLANLLYGLTEGFDHPTSYERPEFSIILAMHFTGYPLKLYSFGMGLFTAVYIIRNEVFSTHLISLTLN